MSNSVKYSDIPPLFVLEGTDGLTYRINRVDSKNLRVVQEKPREDAEGFIEVHMGYSATLHGALGLLAKNYPKVMADETITEVSELRAHLDTWYSRLESTIRNTKNVTSITEE